jgi:hypothetical protein
MRLMTAGASYTPPGEGGESLPTNFRLPDPECIIEHIIGKRFGTKPCEISLNFKPSQRVSDGSHRCKPVDNCINTNKAPAGWRQK